MGKVIAFPPTAPATTPDRQTATSPAGCIFIGRERELEELRTGLEEACAGRGRLILLVGEPGIGKTRTAHELATHARLRSVQVFLGRCYEGEGAPPFWPWVQIVRAYLATCDVDTLQAEMGGGAANIAQVMTEVRERLPDLPMLSAPESPQERFRFFDSFTTFLKNAARRQPLLLMLDDLHWADTPSLLLLQFLARELGEAHIMVVGAYRDNELGLQHPLLQTLGELGRTPGSQSLVLPGLTESEVARFIELNTNQTLSQSLVKAVYQRTEGSPFFVTEIVRLLMTEGDQSVSRQPQAAIALPPRVREVIRRRLQALSEECYQILAVASVLGREFDLKVLKQASEAVTLRQAQGERVEGHWSGATVRAESFDGLRTSSVEARTKLLQPPIGEGLLEVLDEAVAARLIAPVPQRVGLYSFSHALIRETLYETLSMAERVRLHRHIGEALEELYRTDVALPSVVNPEQISSTSSGHVPLASSGQGPSTGSGQALAELAAHFFLAAPGGDVDKAISYARRAGERAITLLAYEEAVSHYERALQALTLKGPDEVLRCELLLALGEALWRAGENLRARDIFEQAAQAAQALGAAELLAQAALGFGNVRAETGVVDEALVEILEAAQAALGNDASALRAKVLARLAMALYFTRSEEHRNTLSVQALAIARQVGDRGALAFTLLARHFVLWGPGNIEDRLAIATEAIRLAEEAGDRDTMHEGQAWRILALLELGDIDAADQELESYMRHSVQFHLPRHQWYTTLVRANRALLVGRFDEGERLALDAASVRGEGSELTNATTFFGAQMFALRWQQGRLAELEPAMTGFAAQFTNLYIWRCGLAVLHSEAGNYEAARREFGHLVARDFAELQRDANWLPSLALLSEVCRFLGDTRNAEALYTRMLPYAGQNIVVATSVSCYGAAARYLGVLATIMARWEEAEQHFTAALALNTRMGARSWVAYTEYDYAVMLLARNQRGDQEKAMELLDLALTTAQELGMMGLEEKIKLSVASCQLSVKGQSEPRGWRLETGSSSQASSPKPQASIFRQEGDYWTISYESTVFRLKDVRGLHYIAHLLRHPHHEFHALELITVEAGTHMSRPSDAGEVLDAKARAAYKRRLEDLRAKLEEAQAYNDLGRTDKAMQEIEFLTAELATAVGLQGRSRKVAAHAERARVSVTRRITVARQKIAVHSPALERYLAMTIKTGLFCSYTPHLHFLVSWQF